MKLSYTCLVSFILTVSCAFQAQGATPSRPTRVSSLQGKKSPILRATGEVDGPTVRFAEMIGVEVRNAQDEKLGRIKAITVDLANSRMVEVLVGSKAGLFGFNERLTPVPPQAITYDDFHEVARLNVTPARFNAAPTISRRDSATYGQQDRIVAASRYFGVVPWFAHGGKSSGPRLGYVQTTEAIEMMQIKNPQGKYLGEVGLLLLNLRAGRIVQVVDESNSMDDSNYHILPLKALSYNSTYTGLVLNETFPELLRQPHLRWSNRDGGPTNFVEERSPILKVPAKTVKVASAR
ncbi:PRC-barrel domain-containing protein [Prosthecobacter sp.]|uniref:PRC-barrel domain-containing protein n=1 Tax=Prosthecobacter sp. TaxID=1965333 RepID=UPI003783516F